MHCTYSFEAMCVSLCVLTLLACATPLVSLPGGFFANQFENTANFETHYSTTGPEIWSQTNGQLDAFVMSSGTSSVHARL